MTSQLPLSLPLPVPDWLHRRASRAGWAEVRRAAGMSGREGTWPRVGEHGDQEGEEVCGE